MKQRTCGGCGSVEGTRIRVVFSRNGAIETCDACDPNLRKEITVHSTTDRKIWRGDEVDPHRYKKTEGPNGETIYVATDEQRVDHEAAWQSKDVEQTEKAERIMAQRRQFGRTDPMTLEEIIELRAQVQNKLEAAEVRE